MVDEGQPAGASNWPEVLRLVRSLDKHNALHPALSSRLRELAYEALLSDSTPRRRIDPRVWSTVPLQRPRQAVHRRARRHAPSMRAACTTKRARLPKKSLARRLGRPRRARLPRRGRPGRLAIAAGPDRSTAKRGCSSGRTDAELALTLGSLCLKQKLWGKAQRYLEQALSDATEARMVREAHLKLAQMHEALGQDEQAAKPITGSAHWPRMLCNGVPLLRRINLPELRYNLASLHFSNQGSHHESEQRLFRPRRAERLQRHHRNPDERRSDQVRSRQGHRARSSSTASWVPPCTTRATTATCRTPSPTTATRATCWSSPRSR